MKLVNFRRLKSAVGHENVNENEVQIEVIYQPPTYKDKIYLKQDLNWAGWPRDDLTDQGGAVVPDDVTIHKLRPETHD